MILPLSAPEALLPKHRLDEFNCGEPVLDEWLKRRAMGNQFSGASRTFVVADINCCVYGYYAMAAGAVSHQKATRSTQQNMPDPIPVLVLARLAVDVQAQGHALGAALLQDAVKRAMAVAHHAGVRALLVHALHERAKQFYQHYGFKASPLDELTLMLAL
jgi:GNAT superfamily N-acetyltransferase